MLHRSDACVGSHLKPVELGAAGDVLDRTPHGTAAVEGALGSLQHLDAIQVNEHGIGRTVSLPALREEVTTSGSGVLQPSDAVGSRSGGLSEHQ
jgi:hypothetical protein